MILQDYVRRDYVTEVSVGRDVYINPILPVPRPIEASKFYG